MKCCDCKYYYENLYENECKRLGFYCYMTYYDKECEFVNDDYSENLELIEKHDTFYKNF